MIVNPDDTAWLQQKGYSCCIILTFFHLKV